MESICQLSASSSEFASCCLDFLVDMFNDEIEAVRYVLVIEPIRRSLISIEDSYIHPILSVAFSATVVLVSTP